MPSDTTQDRDALKDVTMEAVRRHFAPEFLNRIDNVIVFNRCARKAAPRRAH
jgi:ATP-dependent Clp protease ATP-binding subunit ClpA